MLSALIARKRKNIGVANLAYDLLCATVADFLALSLSHKDLLIPSRELIQAARLLILVYPLFTLALMAVKAHRSLWRYTSIHDALRLAEAVIVGIGLSYVTGALLGILSPLPPSFFILFPAALFACASLGRMTVRILHDRAAGQKGTWSGQRALIVGAGRGGALLYRDLRLRQRYQIIGFVDDDERKIGKEVHGAPVLGKIDDLVDLVTVHKIKVVLVAMPSAPAVTLDRIVRLCAKLKVTCRTMPLLPELASEQVSYSSLREITVEDLLRRAPIVMDMETSRDFYSGKSILVTGGAGSIGAELCRQVARLAPAYLMILDKAETPLYRIERELRNDHPSLVFNVILGRIEDEHLLERLFKVHPPDIILHAAAYKHVPLAEDNVVTFVQNNIFGTRTLVQAALRYGVERFVLVSTDKTVNPSSVMGVTKRVTEIYCQSLQQKGCHFITTRFGNVLDSSGSVVPLFREQIAHGGPVTVTDPEVSRYFMLIDEAASLILQAGRIGKGGEIFILDMGEPIRIRELAEQMIRLAGYEPERDIPIVYTGLRHGEKLHEELFYERETLKDTMHPKILLADGVPPMRTEDLEAIFRKLEEAVREGHEGGIRALLRELVPEYGQTPKKVHSATASLHLISQRAHSSKNFPESA